MSEMITELELTPDPEPKPKLERSGCEMSFNNIYQNI